jgi:hypothetical protein
MSDLVERLRALSRLEHSDCTIGDEAADELERMQATITEQALQYLAATTQAHEAWQETQRLRAELAKHQESQWHPDWSLLEATREGLHEAWEETQRLRAQVEALRADAMAYRSLSGKP